MKKFLILFIAVFALCSCSKDTDETVIVKTSENVTTEDIMGDWIITYPSSLNGAKFVLHNMETCTWSNKFGYCFSGPYYFIENINDDVLKQQGLLLDLQNLNKIHIETIKVRNASGDSNNKRLLLICDLKTFLPHPDYLKKHLENIDRDTYYFWEDNDFDYSFEIINYNDNYMELKLTGYCVRFGSYINNYPLRLENNTIIKLSRINK